MQDIKDRVAKLVAEFEEVKQEYKLPNSGIDIGEMYNYAWHFCETIKELTEREAKLVEVLKALQDSDKIRQLYLNEYEKKGYLLFIEAKLKELGY